MNIAHRLSAQYDISVLHPAEVAPFPFNLMKKYRNLAGRQGWYDGNIEVKTFRYIRIFGKKRAFALLRFYKRRIKRLFCNADIQLIHAHFALSDGLIACEIHKILGIPYIISFRDSDIKFLELKNCSSKKLINRVLSEAAQIIVHNEAHQEIVAKAGFQSVVMPHGVDADFIKPKNSAGSHEDITIACISGLIARKNVGWIVDAVKNYRGTKHISLKIAGDGPLRNDLEAVCDGAENIRFLGNVPHEKIGDLLDESQIFALPSVNETFGLVYLEAAARQNAVIAMQGTGVWGVFKDKEEMLFCNSPESFTEMLYQLIDNDKLREEMAKKAYEKTAHNFTWDKIISRYSEIYNSCL